MTSNVKTYTPLLIALSPVALFILSVLVSDEPVMVFMPLYFVVYAVAGSYCMIVRLQLVREISRRYPGFDTRFIGPFTISRAMKQLDDAPLQDRYWRQKLLVRSLVLNFSLGILLGFTAAVLS